MVGLAVLVMIVMKRFSTLPVARSLHLWLVETPLEHIAAARRHHLICLAVMVALLLAPETLMLLGAADLSILTFALDMSLYIDSVAAITLAGAVAGGVRGWGMVRHAVTRRLRPVNRMRRRRTAPRLRPPANDNSEADGDRIAA